MFMRNDSTIQPDGEHNGRSYLLPPVGDNPSTKKEGTTPGSFANKNRVGTAYAFSSPDTTGMPEPSDKTAWDFLPEGWRVRSVPADTKLDTYTPAPCFIGDHPSVTFRTAYGEVLEVAYPINFSPITQLEHARLGVVTPQMNRVAEREPHLTPEQVRDEIAAGRMVIPANINHLKHSLDPMAIGRASKTKINANMGASPISSGTEEEVEKLRWAEKWARTR